MAGLEHMETLSRSALATDPGDLPGLVALQDLCERCRADAEAKALTDVVAGLEAAICGIESIVMRTAEDADAQFAAVLAVITGVQTAVEGRRPAAGLARDRQALSVSGSGAAGPAEDPELLREWIENSSRLIGDLEACVLAVEATEVPGGQAAEELAALRRTLHTIKGECGVLGLHDAQALFHDAESVVDAHTAGACSFPAEALLLMLDWFRTFLGRLGEDPTCGADGHDRIRAQLRRVAAPGTPRDPDGAPAATEDSADDRITLLVDPAQAESLREFLTEAHDHIDAAEESLLSLEQEPSDRELINTVFRAFHTIKGVAGFLGLQPIAHLAHNAEYLLDAARSAALTLDRAALDLVLVACDVMRQLVGVPGGGEGPSRAGYDALNAELAAVAKGKPAEAGTIRATATGAVPSGPESRPAAAGESGPTARPTRPRTDQTVKVSTLRMDNLVTMVGELVIAQQMVMQDANDLRITDVRLQRNLSHVWKIVRDLQGVSMSLRMVNLRGTFQKMARLVRDVAAKAGKRIQFHCEGEDVELDRNVVEEIADPLVHMVRNSCDHGIEPADERRRAGKPESGSVTLRAYHAGGSIVIEIEDDGRGLDRQRILRKAIDRGVVPAGRNPEELSESDVFNMIFLPGFSTAEQVTDISGRGVGMDVVRRNIEALRGKVDIRSEHGRGTTFLMRLPLTMAIIDGMIVRVGPHRYVIPTLSIEHSFRPASGDLSSIVQRGEMVSVRGSVLPVHRLHSVLGVDDGVTDPRDALLIVLESNEGRCALMVDEIIGQQQVVIKRLGRGMEAMRGVSGGAILGDGRVALILDVSGIIQQAVRRPE